jgi:threonyl-tRNA synthetase
MEYVGADGKKHEPVMLHMACFGSIERFLGMYIENCEGKFPLWVNPVQGAIINVNDTVNDYCKKIAKEFKDNGLRFEIDLSNNSVQSKIKQYSEQRVPFIIVIGSKEKDANSVTIRTIGSENQKTLSVSEFINKMHSKISNKDLDYSL